MSHDESARPDADCPAEHGTLPESIARDLGEQARDAHAQAHVTHMGQLHGHEHGEHDACAEALEKVHAFLSNQLPATEADLIRAHLDACEKCFDDFDIEATITRLLQRSCQSPCAPESLKVRIMGMRIDPID